MAIKNLTTNQVGRLPRLGYLKKGSKKKTINKDGRDIQVVGDDLDYFRLASSIEKVNENWLKLFPDNQPKEITCMLMADTTDLAFPCFMEEWGATGLITRCNGEIKVIVYDVKTNKLVINSNEPCNGYENCAKCKPIGKLNIIVPGLQILGYLEVQTHSKHDIAFLTSQLRIIQETTGSLMGIPFILTRSEQEITIKKGSERGKAKKNLMSIRVADSFGANILQAASNRAYERLALTPALMNEQLALMPASDLSDNAAFSKLILEIRKAQGLSADDVKAFLRKSYQVDHPGKVPVNLRHELIHALTNL